MSRPTDEEIRKVHQWECAQNGHDYSFTEVRRDGSIQRVELRCDHCKKTWSIEP